ncbi:hypothetical protein AB0N48_19150 [Micromonospora chalcea]|uniref:hypothetical protein n=1 Tax=Micromonospora chalcea TaxID=1874 RepID=UPI003417C2BC
METLAEAAAENGTDARSATYRAHPLVRIEPAASDLWLISRDDRLNGHKVPASAAGLLVAAFAPGTIYSLSEPIMAAIGSVRRAELIAEWLVAHEYLVRDDDAEAIKTRRWLESWAENGWRAASRYHARTYGYPFEFYEADGNSAEDVRRMVAYNAQQPDVDRARPRLHDQEKVYALPDPAPELFLATASAATNLAVAAQPLDYDRLASLLSLLTRPIRQARMPFAESANLLRKTSPSGGSRHPTEFSVVTHAVGGIDDGVYQVATVDGALDRMDHLDASSRDLADLSGIADDNRPYALIFFNSYFARNRYRYREPRTFRTVHMDVGHLMGTAEYLSRANGWAVRHAQHLDGKKVADALGTDHRVEATIAATLVHAADQPAESRD